MPDRLRIFISSPGDVAEERLRANLVVQKLARDYARFFKIESYLWEHEPMLASGHFQDAIEPPSACDVVVLIVYSRLGTALPERTATRQYRGLDGRAPVTGTEWEFEEALAAHQIRGAPDLLAYRKLGDPGASLANASLRAEQERQWLQLEAFWTRYFENNGLFLAGSAKFHSLDEFDQKLEGDLTALIERRIKAGQVGTAVGEVTWLRGNPFRGLATYEFEDAPVFFGRDGQTRAALTRILAAAERGTAFLLVLGASGSGKSSLARAGLLPGLFGPKAVAGVGIWRRVVLRPGEGGQDPVLGLARALISGNPVAGEGLPELLTTGIGVEALATHLAASADDPSFPFRQALDKVAVAARSNGGLLGHEIARLVILADQVEELFTRNIAPERRTLFVRILAGLARSGVVWVVATMRNDLWHRAAQTPSLVELVEAGARLELPVPDGSELIEIVRRPAIVAGLLYETDASSGVGLDAVIARAAAEEPGALPLLSVMLDTLYQRDIAARSGQMGKPGTMAFSTYRAMGELRGAIALRADETLAQLEARDREAAAAFPQVLRALVSTVAGKAVARGVPIDSFVEGGPEARLVTAFLASDARLLVAAAAPTGAEVRLAHEALIENWPRARAQIAKDQRDLETRARLEALQRRWSEASSGKEKQEALLHGLNLAEGTDLARRWGIGPNAGLGQFVAASRTAAARQRRLVAGAAFALLLVFAAIAVVALWQRQEAVASQVRVIAALRDASQQTARSLAAQSVLQGERHDVQQALRLALSAGDIENPIREHGKLAASAPALLQALEETRQVLHVRLPYTNYPPMPVTFLDDETLVYAPNDASLMHVDFKSGSPVAERILLQGMVRPHILRAVGSNMVAVGGDKSVALVDLKSMQVHASLPTSGWVNDLDVDLKTRMLATSNEAEVLLVSLDRLDAPLHLKVPVPQPNTEIGQVRFSANGAKLYVTYGIEVLAYDIALGQFSDKPLTDLDMDSTGFSKPQLASFYHASRGRVALVKVAPDLVADGKVLLLDTLQMSIVDASTRAKTKVDRSDPLFQGLSFTDQQSAGKLTETVVIQGERSAIEQSIQLRYFDETSSKLLPDFEHFSVLASVFDGNRVKKCRVSLHTSFLACQYRGDNQQGLIVWRLLGGAHRQERLLTTAAGSAVIVPGNPPLALSAGDKGLFADFGARQIRIHDVMPGWQLLDYTAPFVTAVNFATHQVQVLHFDKVALSAAPIFAPLAGVDARINAQGTRLIVIGLGSLTAYDLPGGQLRWTVPGTGSPFSTAVSADGEVLALATKRDVRTFDAATGRLVRAITLDGAQPGRTVLDHGAQRLGWVDSASVIHIITLATGQQLSLPKQAIAPSRLTFSPDGKMLVVGSRDGSITAFGMDAEKLWVVPSPLRGAFSEGEAMPQQQPRGTLLRVSFSPDSRRFAIVRQDLPTIDIHDSATGTYLTHLSTPWSYGIPAEVHLGDDGLVASSWAVLAQLRDKPSAVMLHQLPVHFEDLLALDRSRLATLQQIWSADGPPLPQGPAHDLQGALRP